MKQFNQSNENRKLVIWIDDMRYPLEKQWWDIIMTSKKYVGKEPIVAWVKTYDEFVNWLNTSIHDKEVLFPTLVCFDHDLGEEKTGFDCAKYLVNFCMEHNIELPRCTCHSSNPVGKENILSYIESYKKSLR